MKKNKPYDRTVYQSLTMILQFGINMIVPIAMMTALGVYLDKKLGTAYITILFFFIGAVAGGQNIYRMAKKIYSEPESSYMAGRKAAKTAVPTDGELLKEELQKLQSDGLSKAGIGKEEEDRS